MSDGFEIVEPDNASNTDTNERDASAIRSKKPSVVFPLRNEECTYKPPRRNNPKTPIFFDFSRCKPHTIGTGNASIRTSVRMLKMDVKRAKAEKSIQWPSGYAVGFQRNAMGVH